MTIQDPVLMVFMVIRSDGASLSILRKRKYRESIEFQKFSNISQNNTLFQEFGVLLRMKELRQLESISNKSNGFYLTDFIFPFILFNFTFCSVYLLLSKNFFHHRVLLNSNIGQGPETAESSTVRFIYLLNMQP